jgi:hypothetical protein
MLLIFEKSLNFLPPQCNLAIFKPPKILGGLPPKKNNLETGFSICKSLSEITPIAEKDNKYIFYIFGASYGNLVTILIAFADVCVRLCSNYLIVKSDHVRF